MRVGDGVWVEGGWNGWLAAGLGNGLLSAGLGSGLSGFVRLLGAAAGYVPRRRFRHARVAGHVLGVDPGHRWRPALGRQPARTLRGRRGLHGHIEASVLVMLGVSPGGAQKQVEHAGSFGRCAASISPWLKWIARLIYGQYQHICAPLEPFIPCLNFQRKIITCLLMQRIIAVLRELHQVFERQFSLRPANAAGKLLLS